MEKFMKKRGAMLIVYIPRELDHHFAQQITGALDQSFLVFIRGFVCPAM